MQPTKEQEQEFNRMQETVQAIMQTLPPDTSEPERRITKIKARRIDDAEEITIAYEVFHDKAKDGWFSASFTSKEEARNDAPEKHSPRNDAQELTTIKKEIGNIEEKTEQPIEPPSEPVIMKPKRKAKAKAKTV